MRFIILALGVGIGMLLKMIAPIEEPSGRQPDPPAAEQPDENSVPDENSQETNEKTTHFEDPLVPPLVIPGLAVSHGDTATQFTSVTDLNAFDEFAHDSKATFHPHGEQVCASGCAASRHPTPELSAERFQELLDRYAIQPMSEESTALEELLFYGRQSRTLLAQLGPGALDPLRAAMLEVELHRNQALIEIRLVDEAGEIRSWQTPTQVPLDRRHVFEMQTKRLQPLVTSGTVKRVGLDYVWTRL